jgi:hypothetical protein
MGLENATEHKHKKFSWREALGFAVGLTEPTGGQVMISVETSPNRWVGILCDSQRAREIAETINNRSDVVAEWEKNHE